jgi:hypothetical protein
MSRDAAPSPGSALRAKLSLAIPALATSTSALWNPAGLTARYLDYLQVMHGVIRASIPLMETARARCRQSPADPLAAALSAYFTAHIAEEQRHDDWLLEDLAAAGRHAGPADPPGPPVARLVGAQYYWIRHYHPVCLLGYIAVLEGSAPPPWLSGHLASLTGLPAAAFRTLDHHAAADLSHEAGLYALIDQLPLTPAQERAIAISALTTVDGLIELLSRLAGRMEEADDLR